MPFHSINHDDGIHLTAPATHELQDDRVRVLVGTLDAFGILVSLVMDNDRGTVSVALVDTEGVAYREEHAAPDRVFDLIVEMVRAIGIQLAPDFA